MDSKLILNDAVALNIKKDYKNVSLKKGSFKQISKGCLLISLTFKIFLIFMQCEIFINQCKCFAMSELEKVEL